MDRNILVNLCQDISGTWCEIMILVNFKNNYVIFHKVCILRKDWTILYTYTITQFYKS